MCISIYRNKNLIETREKLLSTDLSCTLRYHFIYHADKICAKRACRNRGDGIYVAPDTLC